MENFTQYSPLTLHETGVSGKPTAYDKLMGSMHWKAAKNRINPETEAPFPDSVRLEGGLYIVQQLWSDRQTEQLRGRLDGKEPLFIAMPSTTGQNLLPVILARVLQQELGGQVIDGVDVAKVVHTLAMKDVPVEQRPFVPREYILKRPAELWKTALGKAVVVVEDVFSSGASAKAFCDSLAECKIQVTTVAGLLGDSRLSSEPQLVQKLAKTMKLAGIPHKAKDVASVLSRGQVNTLIDVINTRGKNECESIAKGIQRVFDSRAARYMGQDSWRGLEGGIGHSPGKSDRGTGFGVGVSVESRGAVGGGRDRVENGKSGDAVKSDMGIDTKRKDENIDQERGMGR